MSVNTFSSRAALLRPTGSRFADVAVFAGAAVLLWLVVRVASGTTVPWTVDTAPSSVSTDPANLPYYTARSLLRMFIALGLSVLFTFIYATAAARLRRAEKVLVPLLDILQSVPILGFLSITVTGFIALFPGSQLGLECASIFAIFTSQAWNMTFAFYHSLKSQSRDLDEAARLLRLSRWQRFWRIDLPGGMKSGLREVQGILDGVEDIAFCTLTNHDVVRHRLVKAILRAYDKERKEEEPREFKPYRDKQQP